MAKNKMLPLNESIERRRFEKGQVPFSKSSVTDPYIREAIKIIASHSTHTETYIVDWIQRKVQKNKRIYDTAPELFETIAQNDVENILFNVMEEHDIPVPGAPKFNNLIFNALVKDVLGRYSGILTGFIQRKTLLKPFISYCSKEELEEAQAQNRPMPNYVPTAAATESGNFYFNLNFMQNLINWAYLKQIKPKHLCFKNRGGNIPDCYGYIEFLIMHEFLHYAEEDFFYSKIIKDSEPTAINYTGDFRSNYILVKSGFEQLPIGLFSDDINYDRQSSYRKMYQEVIDARKKAWIPDIGRPVVDDKGQHGIIINVHANGDIETKDCTEQEAEEAYKIWAMQQMMNEQQDELEIVK